MSGFGDEGVALGAVRLALDHVDSVLHGPGELVDPKHFLTGERPRTRIEP